MKKNSNWDDFYVKEMSDLTFAKPSDFFLYTRFTVKSPERFEGQQILYTDSITQLIDYVRHIFLYDILNDIADDIQYDFKTAFDERQSDIITVMNYWFKFGKLVRKNNFKQILALCDEFDSRLSYRENTEYEIRVFNGANELCDFLISRYKYDESCDKKQLRNICSKEIFAGKPLKDFIENLFNS